MGDLVGAFLFIVLIGFVVLMALASVGAAVGKVKAYEAHCYLADKRKEEEKKKKERKENS